MVKMLSAAGARNVETRVRSSEQQRKYHNNHSSHNNDSFHHQDHVVEWHDTDEYEATHSHHHGLRRSDTKGSSKEYNHGHSHGNNNHHHQADTSERHHRPTLARPRLSVNVVGVNKEKIHDKFTLMKQRSRNGMDSMKQRSKRGFDTVKERSSKVLLPRRPNIRLRSPKELPVRSLFRHEPRTWFGAKKEKGDKVKEDWRNSRPTQSGSGGGGNGSNLNSNSPGKKDGGGGVRGREEMAYHRKSSDQERSSTRRSRSAPRRRSFAEDGY